MKKTLIALPLALAAITASAADIETYQAGTGIDLTGQIVFGSAHDEEGEKLVYPTIAIDRTLIVTQEYDLGKTTKTVKRPSTRHIQLMANSMQEYKALEAKKGKTITVHCELDLADSGNEFTPVTCRNIVIKN